MQKVWAIKEEFMCTTKMHAYLAKHILLTKFETGRRWVSKQRDDTRRDDTRSK